MYSGDTMVYMSICHHTIKYFCVQINALLTSLLPTLNVTSPFSSDFVASLDR